MMKGCRIEIITHTEGNSSRTCALGTITETEKGAFVVYRTEGDETSLFLGKDACTMNRCGSANLHMEFSPKRQTQFLLSEGVAGAVPVYTHRYEVKKNAQGMRVTLGYEVLYPKNKQRFLLKLNVNITEES